MDILWESFHSLTGKMKTVLMFLESLGSVSYTHLDVYKRQACITENIRFTKSDKESLLLQMDVIAALRSMEGKYQFDIIFMDPPYDKELEREVLEYLKSSSLLKEDTLMITEASLQTDLSYVNELGFMILKEKCYKTNKHIFIQKQ